MTNISSEAPSHRALKHLANRNNVAGLYLRKRLTEMEKEKNFHMTYMDKDRLDVTDFLKNLRRCDSDDLPQSKLIRKHGSDDDDDDDDDDGKSDNTTYAHLRHRRQATHTAKTAPGRIRVGRHNDVTDDDDDDVDIDDDDEGASLDDHPRRQVKTSVPSRRQMLIQRHREDKRAMESKYEKTEVFLSKLRQDEARLQQADDVTCHVSEREFSARLLHKIRTKAWVGYSGDERRRGIRMGFPSLSGGVRGLVNGVGGGGGWVREGGGRGRVFWTGPNDGQGEELLSGPEDSRRVGGGESWAGLRPRTQGKDQNVTPLRRLGNIATQFQKHDAGRKMGSRGRVVGGGGEGRGKGGGGKSGGREGLRSGKGRLPSRGKTDKKRGGSGHTRASSGKDTNGTDSDDDDENDRNNINNTNTKGGKFKNAVKKVLTGAKKYNMFEITEDDPPSSALPRPAGMPDLNRGRRDTLVDTARAFGFGEAAVVLARGARPPSSSHSSGPSVKGGGGGVGFKGFGRAGLAERRRAERQAKAGSKATGGAGAASATKGPPQPPKEPDGPVKASDMLRALIQMKHHFQHKPLEHRIQDFLNELDDLQKSKERRSMIEEDDEGKGEGERDGGGGVGGRGGGAGVGGGGAGGVGGGGGGGETAGQKHKTTADDVIV